MKSHMNRILRGSCLRPTMSLYHQLLISFGSSALLTLTLVVALTCLLAHQEGKNVKDVTQATNRIQILANLHEAAGNQAEELTRVFAHMDGTVQLMVEIVRDRIVGYPFVENEENTNFTDTDHDADVPFIDRETGLPRYPLNVDPLPIGWQINWNVVPENADEHLQERSKWLIPGAPTSTATASWFVQGICNPQHQYEWEPAYFPNCTDAHNDMSTGGAVHPTRTARFLHDASGDLGVMLKPLYEAEVEAYVLMLAWVNDGAGAFLTFPGFHSNLGPPYESQGCDWLLETTNPFTGEPLGTPEQVSLCRPKGTMVPQALYNPMERDWFRAIAQAPYEDGVVSYGPFSVRDSSFVAIAFGRAMYDRKTKAFLGIAAAFIAQPDLLDFLFRGELDSISEHAIVQFDTGATWVDTDGQHRHANHVRHFQSVVDFDGNWVSREEVHRRMNDATVFEDGKVRIALPLRNPPQNYDPDYRPQFLSIQTFEEEVIFRKTNELNEAVDSEVLGLIWLTVGMGLAGVLLILVTVLGVSWVLTYKLLWMRRVAVQILNHAEAGEDERVETERQVDPLKKIEDLLPKTEVSGLVDEFKKMIEGFSGTGAARVAEPQLFEIKNQLYWRSEFLPLFSKTRNDSKTRKKVAFSQASDSIERFSPSSLLEKPPIPGDLCQDSAISISKSNLANRPKIQSLDRNIKERVEKENDAGNVRVQLRRSLLFWGIFTLLALPLLIIIAIMCGVVSTRTREMVPVLLERAANTSIELELDSLQTLAQSKANLAKSFLHNPIRNVHLLARMAGWLFFDSVKRADSFTEVDEATEECKEFPVGRFCPYFSSDRTPCPCEWRDAERDKYCTANFDIADTRYLQRQTFAVQARGADPVTGDRRSTSYPESDYSPNTTLWWDDPDLLPGAEAGRDASGFSTSYARLRVASALAVVWFPIYNHRSSLGENGFLGSFIGFEGDGLQVGFPGCDYGSAEYGHFRSMADGNRASQIAPDLCPEGKYGYDPRCRAWYAVGSQEFRESRRTMHISPDYEFVQGQVGTSAVSHIVNLPTNEVVGNVLYDFVSLEMRESFRNVRGDIIAVVVSTGSDAFGHDTVVAPNRTSDLISARIEDLLFLEEDEVHKEVFTTTLLKEMKAGATGVGRVTRLGPEGQEEAYILAYAPITVRSLIPLQHDDITSGVSVSIQTIYSGAVAMPEQELRDPFNAIEADLHDNVDSTNAAFLSVIFFISALFVAFTCLVAVNVVKPTILLLKALKKINEGKADRLPPMENGSAEVRQVYTTFAKLHCAVQTSNNFLFAGNIEMARHIMNDSLHLFRKINNNKAIGVACNNLASSYYVSLYTAKVYGVGSEIEDDKGWEIALELYDESVLIAKEFFEAETDLVRKAEYSEQYADRRFNRGLLLLLIHGDEGSPKDAKALGITDIARSRQLDYDARGFWLEKGLVVERSADLFARMVRRLHGLVTFYHDDEELRLTWDAQELVDDADELLFHCCKEPMASVFDSLSLTGRLQQLESAVIRLEMWLNNFPEAARMGMRMFAEDGYLLESSFQSAAAAIVRLNQACEQPIFSPPVTSSLKADVRKMLQGCRNQSISLGKCVIVSLELGKRWDLDPILDSLNLRFLQLYDDCCAPDDLFGLVAWQEYPGGDDQDELESRDSSRDEELAEIRLLSCTLGLKSENAGLHRATLDEATMATCGRASSLPLSLSLQMIIDSPETLDHDTYILCVCDGSAWDRTEAAQVLENVKRWNEERSTFIHVVVLCLGVTNPRALDWCQALGAVSPESACLLMDSGNIDSTFRVLTKLLTRGLRIRGDLQGITVQQF